jgi:cytochrome c biogenesis protein CcdA
VFYVGLAVTLVPLGMGIAAVSRLVYGYRGTLILVSGLLIIAFGVIQLLGRGFSIGPLSRLQGKIKGDSLASTFALGAVYGFAGFCSGPILGAVLTVAAASGTAWTGAVLLAIYAAGMAAPLFVMALLWDRFDLGHRRWLRGREISIGSVRMHSTNLISGLLFITIGVLFIVYEGTSALEGVYAANGATELAFATQQWVGGFAGNPFVAGAFVALVLLGIAYAVFRWLRNRKSRSSKKPVEHQG